MNQISKTEGAFAFFIAVFLNAFIDLGHKIVIQNTLFKLYDGTTQVILTAIINALILLPFILLLSPAGFLSDKWPKPRVMRIAASVSLLLCCAITASYYLGWFEVAFCMTLLMAAQSAIYSPAKFGYIKEAFGKTRLGQTNGIVSALSIIAILAGIFVFSILFESLYPATSGQMITDSVVIKSIAPIGWVLIFCAALELFFMCQLPEGKQRSTQDGFETRKWLTGKLFAEDLKPITTNRIIKLCAIGLATFWSVGQVMLTSFPAFIKDKTGVENTVWVQGVLACTGIGIALGSLIAGRSSKDHIETGLLPIGACGIAIGLLILPSVDSLPMAAAIFLWVGIMGGLFIVPLNALIQFTAHDNTLGKTLAANNWVQNCSMLVFLTLTVVFSLLGWSSRTLLFIIALVALTGGVYTIYQLPQSLTRLIFTWVLSRRYQLKVQGIKNIPAKGGTLLLGNHVSWIDWAIIQLASPRPVRFVMIKNIYERKYLKWFFDLFGCIPIEPGPKSIEALKSVSSALNAGEVVCLFPEGTISRTGHLAEFKRGFEKACAYTDTDVVIIPFYLRGLWGSKFSRSSSRLKQRTTSMRRDIIVAFGKPCDKNMRAQELKQKVLELSIQSWDQYANTLPSISQQWVTTCKESKNKIVIKDTLSVKLSGLSALTGTLLLAKKFKTLTQRKTIGLLLPTSANAMLANIATLVAGKSIVNLNYSAGEKAMLHAINQADIDTIITSEKFLKKLSSDGIETQQLKEAVRFEYFEKTTQSFTLFKKISTALVCRILPTDILKKLYCPSQASDEIAAIVFSSGSEDAPKGIMLSHKNIMANVKQVADVLNMQEGDIMLSNLPLFHAFGMTATQFLPLLEGIPLVAHPDPTDTFNSAKAIAQNDATIMFGTSTFLHMYVCNKNIHPQMLESLRLVVSGAEKLDENVREQFKLKFNKNIFEGYGATETTPVTSVNLPDQLSMQDWKVQRGNKLGSVGMPLPGSSFKIVDPDTFEELAIGESGMILLGGCQVMKGYLNNAEKTAQVIRLINGVRWYVTGDKGHLDGDGFLYIATSDSP